MESNTVINDDLERINARLIERFGKVNLSGIESASRTIPIRLSSPDAKRLFVRFYHFLQVNMQFVSIVARNYVDEELVEEAEDKIMTMVVKATEGVNRAIVDAEQRFRANGRVDIGSFHIAPLTENVLVFSAIGKRFMELIAKIDHLMLMLETLAINEIISNSEKQSMKLPHKKAVKAMARESLSIRIRLYKVVSVIKPRGDGAAAGLRQPRQIRRVKAPAAARPAGHVEPAREDSADNVENEGASAAGTEEGGPPGDLETGADGSATEGPGVATDAWNQANDIAATPASAGLATLEDTNAEPLADAPLPVSKPKRSKGRQKAPAGDTAPDEAALDAGQDLTQVRLDTDDTDVSIPARFPLNDAAEAGASNDAPVDADKVGAGMGAEFGLDLSNPDETTARLMDKLEGTPTLAEMQAAIDADGDDDS